MNRFWELIIYSQGKERFYCFPFLFLFKIITPIYQFFSRRNLRRRAKNCSGGYKARVISLGNITVGGTGKSPLTVWLAQQFIDRGKKVVIVHSGYGRKSRDDLVIGYGEGCNFDVDQIGDESTMMAIMVPKAGLAVGRDKKYLVKAADDRLKPDVILIDDGYQRLDIAKDLDIAVVNPLTLGLDRTGKGRRLLSAFPGGILREAVDSLSRADAIFVTGIEGEAGSREIKTAAGKYNSSAPVIGWRMSLAGAWLDGEFVDLEEVKKLRPLLFAGIGSYDRLKTMCRRAGIEPADDYGFGDHMDYDKMDIENIINLAKAAKADCYLTTAKDMVKLSSRSFDRPLYCLDLAVEPDEAVADVIGLETA